MDRWFVSCTKAPWQPPDFVFVGVWTTLYTLYAITIARAWNSPALQSLWWGLGLNLLWIPSFMVSPKLGVVVIGAMLTVAAISNRQLKDDDLTNEANFIIVYMVWLSFALSLNLYIASKCAEL